MQLIKLSNFNLLTDDGKTLLKNLELIMQKGEGLHLVGDNGAGKTTLINAIINKHDSYEGSIERNFTGYSYLPQLSNKNPKLPISLGDVSKTEYPFYKKELFSRALQSASGGERKKAMLAKIFSENNDFMILDEPFNHLDQKSREQVSEYLHNFIRSGKSLLITGHHDLGFRKENLSRWS